MPAGPEAQPGSLADLLRRLIRRLGPLPVAEFMALALGHPSLGYYARRDPFGTGGDFVTAPEVSQVFGELIGLWCAERWKAMGRPDPVHLVELGPGRGTLMADALRALSSAGDALGSIEVHLVETSRRLRAEQARRLEGHRVAWHASLDGVPDGPILLVANEFFDALPVRQLVRAGGTWRERTVAIEGDRFRFDVASAPANLGMLLPPAEDGTIAELPAVGIAVAATIGARIAADGGAALVIDYGRDGDGPPFGSTLQAVRAHRREDPLEAPGEVDISTLVDFARLAEAARGEGAAVWGPVPQRAFLTRLGIEARTARLAAAAPDRADALARACRRLIHPDEMGTLFKVLAIQSAALGPPPGFEGISSV